MSGRNVFLVAYDVRDSKRLRRTHKTLGDYGDALQFSVFQCAMSASEKELLLGELSEIIHHKEDRILIVDLGPQQGCGSRAIQVLGNQELPPDAGPVVI